MCDCVAPSYTNSCSRPKLNASGGISTNGVDILKTLTKYQNVTTLSGPNNLEIFTGTKYKIVGDYVHLILDYQFSHVDSGTNQLLTLTGLPVAALTDGRWVNTITIQTTDPVYTRGLIEVQGTNVILKTDTALVDGTNYQILGEVTYKRNVNQACVPCECFIKAKKMYTSGLVFENGVVLTKYLPWTEATFTTTTGNLDIISQETYYSRFDDKVVLSINMNVEYNGAQASDEIDLGDLPIAANYTTDVYSTLAAYVNTDTDNALHLQIRTTEGGANNRLIVIVGGGPFINGDTINIVGQITYHAATNA